MNYRMIGRVLGLILLIYAALLLLPLIAGLCFQESPAPFLVTMAAAAVPGGLLLLLSKPKKNSLVARDGFVIVGLGWILISLIGALPFVLSGSMPHYIDALFETISGFTTTGATILVEVERLSHGMLMWRSLMNWLGGMGVIVFLLALIPKLGGQQNIYLMRAESPGPIVGKAVPKMRHYAAMLYGIYFGLTMLEMILLLCGGMEFFDAINTSFATAGTGGFGVRNANIAAYDTYYFQTVIAVFMMLFGVNFSVYILIITRKFLQAAKMEELWFYLGFIVLSTVIIGINIMPLYPTAYDAFHQSFFYTSSIITTTGFGIGDVNHWPMLSKSIIMFLTFLGAMAGSTGGGFKVARLLLLAKEAKKEFLLLVHPRNIRQVKMDGKTVDHNTMRSTSVFLVVYMAIFVISFILVSIDGKGFVTSFTSVAATLNNTGPGLGDVGPVGNYTFYSPFAKCVLSFDMLAGRLELYPLLLLFAPAAWKKS